MGINPGKLTSPSPRSAGRAGGFIGRPPRHQGRQGRAGGFIGRGNEAGAAARPDDLGDLILETAGAATTALGALPEIYSTSDPTYSEFLEAYSSPIGRGELLFSGMDPADPGDCDRYPDSPLCGGSIVDPGAIGLYGPLPITGGWEIHQSSTETLLYINASLFGIPVPPLIIGFRSEDAQDVIDEFWRPGPENTTLVGEEHWGNPGADIFWIIFRDTYQVTNVSTSLTEAYLDSFENKVFLNIPSVPIQSTNGGSVWRFAYLQNSVSRGFTVYQQMRASGADVTEGSFGNFSVLQGSFSRNLFLTEREVVLLPESFGYQYNPDFQPYGQFESTETRNLTGYPSFTTGVATYHQSVFPPRLTAIPYKPPPPPPPPPPLPPYSPAQQDEPMACDCKKLEELLKKILALLDHEGEGTLNLTPCALDPDNPPEDVEIEWKGKGLKGVFQALTTLTLGADVQHSQTKCVAPRLGVDSLPWVLPVSLGRPKAANGSEDEGVTIQDFASLQLYHFKQLSEMLGQTEISIKIADSNLTEEGDQELTLKFANISEALAEIAGMALTSQSIGNATLKAAMTAVAQSGMAATSAATANQHAEEIQDFLGYEVKRDVFEMPLAYTPGESAPDKMLKPSLAKLSYWNNVDPQNLQTHMATMEFAAAIIRAALYERIGDVVTGTDTIKDRVRETQGGAGSDFDTFLERVETGYSDAPGSTDITPYGRDYSERPRIRKLGEQSNNDGSNT